MFCAQRFTTHGPAAAATWRCALRQRRACMASSDASVELLRAAVRSRLASMDASHDFAHIERVERLAVRIAEAENGRGNGGEGAQRAELGAVCVGGSSRGAQGPDGAADVRVVRVAALCHDLEDWKYSGSDEAAYPVIRELLENAGLGALADRVCSIVRGVSFHGELGASAGAPLDLETAVVQDADRLDALGAIGIARAFTFGGVRGRPLHDPSVPPSPGLSKEEYMRSGRQQTTVNHFYEKLLLLKGMMKTETGRALAERRHAVMETYLAQFRAEWDGADEI